MTSWDDPKVAAAIEATGRKLEVLLSKSPPQLLLLVDHSYRAEVGSQYRCEMVGRRSV